MTSNEKKKPTQPAQDAKVVPATPQPRSVELSSTVKMGSAFRSTWQMPSIASKKPDPDPAQNSNESGVRRLDMQDVGQTAGRHAQRRHTLFSAAPPAPEPQRQPSADPAFRTGQTLRDLPTAQQGDGDKKAQWVSAVPVQKVGVDSPGAEIGPGRGDRTTDPMGSERPAAPPIEARTISAQTASDTDDEPLQRPGSQHEPGQKTGEPAGSDSGSQAEAPQRPALWVLVLSGLAIVAAATMDLWAPEPSLERDDNLVLPAAPAAPQQAAPAVQAPAVQGPTAHAPAQVQPARLTRIESNPSGAELVVRGAVVANTPADVARAQGAPAEYVLRLEGYEPELVRVDARSPERISITLRKARPRAD